MKLIILATTVLAHIVYGGDRAKIRLIVSNQNQPIVLRNTTFAWVVGCGNRPIPELLPRVNLRDQLD